MKFVRYGGLSSVRQRGYETQATGFHSPPARRGIYAFIWPYVERFLLNGYEMDPYKPNAKYEWVRDKNGNRIPSSERSTIKDKERDDKYNDYFNATDQKRSGEASRLRKELGIASNHQCWCPKEEAWYYTKLKKRREFEVSGEMEVWHHLMQHVDESNVLARKGEWWILTTVDTLAHALHKEKHRVRVDIASGTWNTHTYKDAKAYSNRHYSQGLRDTLEVFFEKV